MEGVGGEARGEPFTKCQENHLNEKFTYAASCAIIVRKSFL